AEAKGAVAGDGADEARGRHLADALVVGIDDEDVAAGIDRHPGGVIEFGAGGRPAVAAEAAVPAAGGAAAGDGADEARGRHLADALVVGIDDEDVAAGIDRHPGGVIEFGAGGRPAVAAEAAVPAAGGAAAGDGADEARGRHLAD